MIKKFKILNQKKVAIIMLFFTITLLFNSTNYAKDIDNQDISLASDTIVSYDFVKETTEKLDMTKSIGLIDEDLEPYIPDKKMKFDTTIDSKSYEEFEAAGLINESGDFDWESLSKLPTLDNSDMNTFSVIGSDDRKIVEESSTHPYDCIAYMLINFDGTYYRGTGFSIGNYAIGTCGHNVYSKTTESWADSVTIIPARDDDDYPYGSTTAVRLRALAGWTDNALEEYDVGLVETSRNLAEDVGYLGLRAIGADITNDSAELPGYPAEVKGVSTNKMYTATGKIKSQEGLKVYYDINSSGGNSGGPVLLNGPYVGVIHAYGSYSGNSGRRVDSSIRNVYMEYRE